MLAGNAVKPALPGGLFVPPEDLRYSLARMARHFLFLMVGLVFALVNITVNRVDLLPAFVGYVLIAVASHNLGQHSVKFQVARNLSLPLVVISLLVYASPLTLGPALLLIQALLTIVLVCFLLGAIIQFAEDRERPDLVEHGVNYRRFYVGIALLGFLIQLAIQAWPEAGIEGFVGVMGVATIVILAFILRFLYAVRHDLAIDTIGEWQE
jgi:hypothetical protein